MGGSGAGGMCVHPCLCPCVYLCGCPSPKEDAAVIFHTFSPAFFFLFLFFSFFFWCGFVFERLLCEHLSVVMLCFPSYSPLSVVL